MQDQNSNPYASPNATVVDTRPEQGQPELASFGLRLLGVIIDTVIMLMIMVPIMFATGFINIDEMMKGIQPPLMSRIWMAFAGFGVFLLVQGYFLYTSGQTIGKKILGTRIVNADNEKPEFFKLIGLRYATVHFISQIPCLGAVFGIANALCIFMGDERKCLHDRFAGTKVIMDKRE
jgi:uncharacterized RDD family membrane protein YckC